VYKYSHVFIEYLYFLIIYTGPDQQEIFNQGNSYIDTNFPDIDFIYNCRVIEQYDADEFFDDDSTYVSTEESTYVSTEESFDDIRVDDEL
jgi:hypothetical protein